VFGAERAALIERTIAGLDGCDDAGRLGELLRTEAGSAGQS
jgi:hypothetical protein